MKSMPEIIAKLQNLEIRLITNSTDVNRPLCYDERERTEGWVDALRWVLDKVENDDKGNLRQQMLQDEE